MKKQNQTHRKEQSTSRSQNGTDHYLVLFNDDVHEFSFVIESLVEICNHDNLQAEQCAYLAHYKGRCAVKNGDYEDLKAMKEALIDRGLLADIN